MNAIHKKRLLNVARALRDSPDPARFTMKSYAHPCGSPACALGHYAARGDLQRMFFVFQELGSWHLGDLRDSGHDWVGFNDEIIQSHFGITEEECHELFGPVGCGSALTPERAARYIERFVKRKEKGR